MYKWIINSVIFSVFLHYLNRNLFWLFWMGHTRIVTTNNCMLDDHFAEKMLSKGLDATKWKMLNIFFFSKKIRVTENLKISTSIKATAFIWNRCSTELMCCGLPAFSLILLFFEGMRLVKRLSLHLFWLFHFPVFSSLFCFKYIFVGFVLLLLYFYILIIEKSFGKLLMCGKCYDKFYYE